MTYRLLPPDTPLSGYRPPIIGVDCLRCKKGTLTCDVAGARKRFGGNITVGQLARDVAAASTKARCGLGSHCSARALEPPVWHWADLDEALKNGLLARLHCRRHIAALKRTSPCDDVVDLDLETLVAVLGYDFKLERLPNRCKCPKCHTEMVEIEWIVPKPRPAPYSPTVEHPIAFRLKPTRAAVARLTMRVVKGDRA